MSTEWYYIDAVATGDSRRKGPWSSTQMLSFQERGIIADDTLVWNASLSDWQAWSAHKAVAQGEMPAAPDIISVLGTPAPVMARPYAGFWIRGAALFIDSVILQVFYLVFYPLWTALGFTEDLLVTTESLSVLMVVFLVQTVFSCGYNAWFVKKYAGTPGKILLGLSVVRADGAPMGWGTAIGRYFGTWISSITLGIGYLMAAFDDEKRALHDHVAKTRVIRK